MKTQWLFHYDMRNPSTSFQVVPCPLKRNMHLHQQFPHQCTDATRRKSRLIATAIRIGKIFHIPGIGVFICGSKSGGILHILNILFAKFLLATNPTKPLHRSGHHRCAIIFCRFFNTRFFWQAQKNSREHGATYYIHLEPVGLFKCWKTLNNSFIFWLCFANNHLGCFRVISINYRQLFLEGTGK